MEPATLAADRDQPLTPLDWFLAEQADLSAVERFARRHDAHDAHAVPAQARYYRDLIPLDRPAAGQQYGFEVDLDACTGCQACVTACHALNGLDDGESWRSVGSIGTAGSAAYSQTVTSACHHCVDPACLNGCPVKAYEKDPVTGVVSHLDDQCIGCRYCVLTCPYEVPRYNPGRGIVRKCDLCQDRLAVGEAPACVQSCPNAAIRVALVDTAAARASATGALVAGAPASSITVPTTRYISRRRRPPAPGEAPGTSAAALPPPRRGQAHLPLTVMLVLTQMAVGTALMGLAAAPVDGGAVPVELGPASAVVALGVGMVALGASVLHLGRPAYAFRAVLGIRRSWLSREIAAFTAFAALAGAHGVASLAGAGPGAGAGSGARVLAGLAAGAGVAGVACSAQVYAVTGRRWWRLATTATKFALTAVATGAAGALVITAGVTLGTGAGAGEPAHIAPLATVVAVVVGAKLAWELAFLRHLRAGSPPELTTSARLLVGELGRSTRWRVVLGAAGALAALASARAAAHGGVVLVLLASAAALAVVAGELIERWQFFTASAPPRMPSSPG